MEKRLLCAAENGYWEEVKELIDRGAEVNAADEDGWTALHWAAREGNEAVTKVLLDHGANVNATSKWGFTALHLAARDGNEEVAKALIAHGANVNATNKWDFTALHLASREGNEAVAEILKKARWGNSMKDNILSGLLLFLIFLIIAMMGFSFGVGYAVRQICAETQGRYDFCVQKINWEAKR